MEGLEAGSRLWPKVDPRALQKWGAVPQGQDPPKASQTHAGQQEVTSNPVTTSRGAAETLRKREMLEARGRVRLLWCLGRAGLENPPWGHPANHTHTLWRVLVPL